MHEEPMTGYRKTKIEPPRGRTGRLTGQVRDADTALCRHDLRGTRECPSDPRVALQPIPIRHFLSELRPIDFVVTGFSAILLLNIPKKLNDVDITVKGNENFAKILQMLDTRPKTFYAHDTYIFSTSSSSEIPIDSVPEGWEIAPVLRTFLTFRVY